MSWYLSLSWLAFTTVEKTRLQTVWVFFQTFDKLFHTCIGSFSCINVQLAIDSGGVLQCLHHGWMLPRDVEVLCWRLEWSKLSCAVLWWTGYCAFCLSITHLCFIVPAQTMNQRTPMTQKTSVRQKTRRINIKQVCVHIIVITATSHFVSMKHLKCFPYCDSCILALWSSHLFIRAGVTSQ